MSFHFDTDQFLRTLSDEKQRRGLTGTGGNDLGSRPELQSLTPNTGGPPQPEFPRRLLESAQSQLPEEGAVIGGITGAVAGAPFAPPFGMIAGGAAGAFIGSGVGAALQDITNKIDSTLPPGAPLPARIQTAVSEALLDYGLGVGAVGMGELLRVGKKGAIALFGGGKVGKEGIEQAAKDAQEFGIETSISDRTRSKFGQFLPRAMGGFPLLNEPFRKAFVAKGAQILNAKDSIINRLGPMINFAKLGIRVNRAADKRFSAFRTKSTEMYEAAHTRAVKSGATVPKEALDKAAFDALKFILRHKGKIVNKDAVVKLLRETTFELADDIPYERYDGFLGEIDTVLSTLRSTDSADKSFAALIEFKKVAVANLQKLTDKAAIEMFNAADAYTFKTMKAVFETPTANRFGRIERNKFNKFKFTKAAHRNIDETMDVVWNNKSPQAMKDLKSLVGPKNVEQMAQIKMDQIWTEAIARGGKATGAQFGPVSIKNMDIAHPGGIDFSYIRREFGLDNKLGPRHLVWEEAMKDTGVSMNKVGRLVDAAEVAMRNAPRDTNAFIARRVAIGGLGSLRTILLPTAKIGAAAGAGGAVAGATGVIGGVAVVLLLRMTGEIMSNPRFMKLATDALDDTIRPIERKIKLRFLYEGLLREHPEAFEPPQRPEGAEVGPTVP